MERHYDTRPDRGSVSCDVYIPVWAQTLIDLYISGLEDEVNENKVD